MKILDFDSLHNFFSKISKSHKFFVKETPKFIAGHRQIRWATKEGFGWIKTYWYYPLTFKEKLYYPIAYVKFMKICIKDIN